MDKEKRYFVGICQQCEKAVYSSQLVDIPGLCLHKECLEEYNKSLSLE